MSNKGKLILFSGPSGVGKDTLLEVLYAKKTDLIQSVSATTRKIRDNEVDGKDYYFISKENFELMIQSGNILEYTKYGDNLYGTPKKPIDDWLKNGKTVILKIEVHGAKQIKQLYKDSAAIFIMPPSIEVLEQRLRKRGTESEDDLQKRMEIAISEIEQSSEYDYIVYNDNLETAVDEIIEILNNLN